jgi:hypothetical protein
MITDAPDFHLLAKSTRHIGLLPIRNYRPACFVACPDLPQPSKAGLPEGGFLRRPLPKITRWTGRDQVLMAES